MSLTFLVPKCIAGNIVKQPLNHIPVAILQVAGIQYEINIYRCFPPWGLHRMVPCQKGQYVKGRWKNSFSHHGSH